MVGSAVCLSAGYQPGLSVALHQSLYVEAEAEKSVHCRSPQMLVHCETGLRGPARTHVRLAELRKSPDPAVSMENFLHQHDWPVLVAPGFAKQEVEK